MIYLLNDHKTGYKLSWKLVNTLKKFIKIDVRTFFLFWNIYNKNDKNNGNFFICIISYL